MSRAPSSFRKTDITRAYDAAQKAGHPDAIIEVDLKRGCLRIIPVKPREANNSGDPASIMTPEDLREQI
jgi:hypothetical protein